MISHREGFWLHQCIFGRPPAGDAVLAWDGESFEEARERFLRADEFGLQRGRLFVGQASRTNASCRRDRLLAAMRLQSTEQAEARSPDPDATADPLLRCLQSRFRAQVIVAFGTNAALETATRLARAIGVDPVVVVKCGDERDVEEDVATWLRTRPGALVDGATIVERRVGLAAILDQLERDDLRVDLFIIDIPIDAVTMERCFRRFPHLGLFLMQPRTWRPDWRQVLAPVAHHLQTDVVEIGDYALMQRTDWLSPLRYVPGAPSVPPPARTGRLAVTCIVKNEASNIEGMLRSCVPIADFVAVVDTGSSDDTIRLARSVLANAGIAHAIHEIAFTDFASARNAALDAVPAAYEWTLVLDADEHLVPEDYAKWLDLLASPVEAWMIPRYNFKEREKIEDPAPYPDRQGRLIRNGVANPIRYKGKVHEKLPDDLRWGIAPANMVYFGGTDGGPHIHHMGQVDIDAERWAQKNSFYLNLLLDRT